MPTRARATLETTVKTLTRMGAQKRRTETKFQQKKEENTKSFQIVKSRTTTLPKNFLA